MQSWAHQPLRCNQAQYWMGKHARTQVQGMEIVAASKAAHFSFDRTLLVVNNLSLRCSVYLEPSVCPRCSHDEIAPLITPPVMIQNCWIGIVRKTWSVDVIVSPLTQIAMR